MIEAIRAAFEGDEGLLKFYDPTSIGIDTVDKAIVDIFGKIKEHVSVNRNTTFITLVQKGIKIGYIFYLTDRSLLISFGVNINYRNKYLLQSVFNSMVEKIGVGFQCILWSKNTRAIKWLLKMGMKEESKQEVQGVSITTLKHQLCQLQQG